MVQIAPAINGLYSVSFAGDTFNTVWHMKQALGDKADVGFATRVGTDRISDTFVKELVADKLDVSNIVRDPERTMGLYMIELDGVERSFSYWRSESAARLLMNDETALLAALHDVGLVHLSGITMAILSPKARAKLIDALAIARRGGTIISFDTNIRPKLWSSVEKIRETVHLIVATSDIVLPSFDEEALIWGDLNQIETVERYIQAGVQEVVLKDGSSPVRFYSNGTSGECKTPRATKVVDTSGAGDAFNAGYLSARLMGKSTEASVCFGQQMAREVICHYGARIPKAFVPVFTSV